MKDKSKERTYWDAFDGFYQMGPQKHREYALDLLKNRGVKTLLDVGCGTGPIYQLIKDTMEPTADMVTTRPRWDFEYKGTDYSQGMIEVCEREFPEGNWEVQDARNLTEPDSSWDAVFCMHTLDHLDDYKAAIASMARVAKKYVCIILWRSFVAEGTNLNDRNTMGKEPGEEPWEDTHLQEYSRQVLEDEFEKNGLVIDHVAEGDAINSDSSHYNFIYLLRRKDYKDI